MPEVAIYDSPDLNAFATGPSRNKSLVAVSSGLLNGMEQNEVEAVLAHEISHVANGDMVTLTLLQGIVNTFVIFIARVIGDIVDRAIFRRDEESDSPGLGYFATVMVAELALGILASIIVAWFSRQREFRADRGGAGLAGAHNMKQALHRLRRSEPSHLPQGMSAFGINDGRLAALFRTHPPLEVRIARLDAVRGQGDRSWRSLPASR
jgi:heat shock protein HtpX